MPQKEKSHLKFHLKTAVYSKVYDKKKKPALNSKHAFLSVNAFFFLCPHQKSPITSASVLVSVESRKHSVFLSFCQLCDVDVQPERLLHGLE